MKSLKEQLRFRQVINARYVGETKVGLGFVNNASYDIILQDIGYWFQNQVIVMKKEDPSHNLLYFSVENLLAEWEIPGVKINDENKEEKNMEMLKEGLYRAKFVGSDPCIYFMNGQDYDIRISRHYDLFRHYPQGWEVSHVDNMFMMKTYINIDFLLRDWLILDVGDTAEVINNKNIESKTKIITLCGSMKFRSKFDEVNYKLSSQGYIILTPNFSYGTDGILQPTEDHIKLHNKKIDESDAIFVVNVDNYIGNNTLDEIEYAYNKGKKVFYLSKYEDIKLPMEVWK